MAPSLYNNIMGASAKDPGLIPFLNAKMGANTQGIMAIPPPPMYNNLQDLASAKNSQGAAIKKRMQNQQDPSQQQPPSPYGNNPFINMQQQDITNSRKQGY